MSNNRFKPLDGLRGVAILMVILVHTFSYKGENFIGRGLEAVARAGWVGVVLFFVLSGYLITGILLDTCGKKNYLRDFYARRSLRIFPLYFIFLAFYFFLVPHLPYLSAHLPQPSSETHIYYWAYMANMKEFFGKTAESIPPLDPLWSLAVEEQVYLFWPFLFLFIPRRALPKTFISMALLSFGWRVLTRLSAQSMDLTYGWSIANLEAFAIGGILAWLSREQGKRLNALVPRTTLVSGAFLAGMVVAQRHFNFSQGPVPILTLGTSALILFFASVIGYLVTSKQEFWLSQFLSMAWLRSLGKYSYAIYLFHSIIIELLAPIIYSKSSGMTRGQSLLGAILLTILVTACSYLLGILSWYILEKPFLSLKRYFPLSGQAVRTATLGSSAKNYPEPEASFIQKPEVDRGSL
jgi:peptidoglycan/LPS O-acetylase OafA/YrhL